jgi:DNA repair protein RAD5
MNVDVELQSSQTLFLPSDSDDEQLRRKKSRSSLYGPSSDDERDRMDMEVPPMSSSPGPIVLDDFEVGGKKRKSDFRSDFRAHTKSDDRVDDILRDNGTTTSEMAEKRRKIVQGATHPSTIPTSSMPSSSSNKKSKFRTTYLGEFIVPDAYATLSGRGYLQPGDEVFIVRDLPSSSIKGKKKVSGGTSSASSNKSGGAKQSKLSFAPAVTTSKKGASKKDDNVIIRFENRSKVGVYLYPFALFCDNCSNCERNRKVTSKALVVDFQALGSWYV